MKACSSLLPTAAAGPQQPRIAHPRRRRSAAAAAASGRPRTAGDVQQAASSAGGTLAPQGDLQQQQQLPTDAAPSSQRPASQVAAPPPPPPAASAAASLSNASGGSWLQNLEELRAAADTTLTRLRRQLEAPPPGFPPGPSGDAAVEMLQSPLAFLDNTRQRYGPVAGLLLGGERVVLVADPTAAKAVLVDPGQPTFVKAGTAFFPGSSLTGSGLLVSDGELWKRQRRLSNPAFRAAAVRQYSEAMLGGAGAMLASPAWRDGVARDVYSEFNALTLRVTLEALFGFRTGAGDEAAGREITAAIQDAFRYFARRGAAAMVIPEFVPTPDNLAFTGAVARLDRAIYRLIGERRRELAAAPRPPLDLLDSLLLAADEAGEGMADKALRDELLTLLVAGQETSAIVLGWAAAYLAHHPAAQAAAAAEVDALLGSGASGPGRALEGGDAARLPFVEAVVLEAMRLSPPAYIVGRCASQDTRLGEFQLPKGTTVLVCPHLLHRDPLWWGPDAAAFRPERWLELGAAQQQAQQQAAASGAAEAQPAGGCPMHSSGSSSISSSSSGLTASGTRFLTNLGPNGAFVPFGAGARNCIGSGFAMLESVLVLAAVLHQVRLVPLPGAAFPTAAPQITLRPESVRLLLRKR